MASFQCIGFIDQIKYLQNQQGCFVFVSEFKKGFRRKDGTLESDRYIQWKVIFKQGLVKYINEHFNNGMLVEIKGEVLPYKVVHGTVMEGYSVIGQTINLSAFPRSSVHTEQKMIKDSQLHSDESPDLEGFNAPDF